MTSLMAHIPHPTRPSFPQLIVRCRTVGAIVDHVRSLRELNIVNTKCFIKNSAEYRAALLARIRCCAYQGFALLLNGVVVSVEERLAVIRAKRIPVSVAAAGPVPPLPSLTRDGRPNTAPLLKSPSGRALLTSRVPLPGLAAGAAGQVAIPGGGGDGGGGPDSPRSTEDRSDDAVNRLRLSLVLEEMRFVGTYSTTSLCLSGLKLEYVADLVSAPSGCRGLLV